MQICHDASRSYLCLSKLLSDGVSFIIIQKNRHLFAGRVAVLDKFSINYSYNHLRFPRSNCLVPAL